MLKILRTVGIVLTLFILVFLFIVRIISYHPAPVEDVPVECIGNPEPVRLGQRIKVLSWNIQYLAGKKYTFFYDAPNATDTAPSAEDIQMTFKEVVRVVKDEKPDIVLFQEVDVNAARTGYTNQVGDLYRKLRGDFPCMATAYYWKVDYVPHPKIMGRVGMKLATFSRFLITDAKRHNLPQKPDSYLVSSFELKRALLETQLGTTSKKPLYILNTHFSAFAQGSDTMKRQVGFVKDYLNDLEKQKLPWIMGGDFNLLPPGPAYSDLPDHQKKSYRKQTELKPLAQSFNMIPSLANAKGENRSSWHTHFSNDPRVKAPDRIIDYIFYSKVVGLEAAQVRQADTLAISDHLPVIGQFVLPAAGPVASGVEEAPAAGMPGGPAAEVGSPADAGPPAGIVPAQDP